MKDEPDIVKQLREAEILGLFQSKVQNAVEELETVEEPLEETKETVGFFKDSDESETVNNGSDQGYVPNSKENIEFEFSDLFENVNDLIQAVRPDGTFLYVNSAWKKTLGYNNKEIKKLNIFEIIHPSSKEHCMTTFKRILSGEKVDKVEAIFVSKNGKEIVVEGSVNCRFDNGKPVSTRGIFRDITEQKKVEDELRKSEKQASVAIEAARAFTFSYDIATGRITWGGAIEKITGYTPEEFASVDIEGWTERIHPDDREEILSILQETVQKKDRATAEYRFKTKEGYVALSSISLTEKQDGKPVRLVGILQDITERKKAEEALKESEEKYKAFFEASADGILIADVETKKFQYANPAFLKMLGYSEMEIKERSVTDIHPKDSLKHVISEFEAQAKGEKTLAEDIPCLRKDGTIIYADINTSSTLIDGRKCNIGFFRDVTGQRNAEKEIKYLKEYNENILESNPNPIIVIKGNQIEYINKSFIYSFGKTKNDYISKDLKEVIPVEMISAFEELLQDYDKIKELEIKGKSFSVNSFIVKKAEEEEEEEEEERVGVILQDITERKKAEEAIKRRTEELEKFNKLAVSRELKMIELKEELNELCKKYGEKPRYSAK